MFNMINYNCRELSWLFSDMTLLFTKIQLIFFKNNLKIPEFNFDSNAFLNSLKLTALLEYSRKIRYTDLLRRYDIICAKLGIENTLLSNNTKPYIKVNIFNIRIYKRKLIEQLLKTELLLEILESFNT